MSSALEFIPKIAKGVQFTSRIANILKDIFMELHGLQECNSGTGLVLSVTLRRNCKNLMWV